MNLPFKTDLQKKSHENESSNYGRDMSLVMSLGLKSQLSTSARFELGIFGCGVEVVTHCA